MRINLVVDMSGRDPRDPIMQRSMNSNIVGSTHATYLGVVARTRRLRYSRGYGGFYISIFLYIYIKKDYVNFDKLRSQLPSLYKKVPGTQVVGEYIAALFLSKVL